MKIGIAGPISVNSLRKYLNPDENQQVLGAGAPAVNNLIDGLLRNGHQISVYTLDNRVSAPLVLKGDNLTIFFDQYRPKGRYRMMDMFGKEAALVEKMIREDQPEIVNAHWTYEYALGAINSGFPHLLTFRDNALEILKLQRDFYRLIRFFLDYRVRRKGRFFNVNSIYLQEKLSGFKKDLPVVPNSINEDSLAEKGKIHPAGVFRIVSIANNWSKLKNVSTALKAFKVLRAKYGEQVEYHLIGGDYGPGKQAEAWALEHDLAEGVRFRGVVVHSALLEMLGTYDILLHPSLEESFGNTLVEAMACGLPVIGGKNSGAVPWVLDFGKRGLLVDVTSEQAIAEALERLVLEGDLYNSLSADGIVYVRDAFGSRQIAHRYEELYLQVLNKTNATVREKAILP
jgi:L-malate glycosyltransferase